MGWVPVITKPNSERKALRNLVQQGFDAWLPVFRQTELVKGCKVQRECILFSRYLFVNTTSHWRAIRSTIGVSHVIDSFIPEREMNLLRAREDELGFIVLDKKKNDAVKERFVKGQRVRVDSGPMVGLWGVYQGMSTNEREQVLLNILGRFTRVELAAGSGVAA